MDGINKHRERFLEDWFSLNGKGFFFILCLLYFGMLFLKRTFVIDNIAAFEVLQERGEMWIMNIFFGLQYLSVPVFLAWKFTLTTFILWVGCFMFGYRVTFAQLWKMVMIMELVFLIPELLKIFWFMFFQTDPDYQDVVAFYPFSLINLIDYTSIEPRWHYPLKALNIFEIIYWGLLISGVHWLSNKKFKISVLIVSSSYILFFFLWLIYFLVVYK